MGRLPVVQEREGDKRGTVRRSSVISPSDSDGERTAQRGNAPSLGVRGARLCIRGSRDELNETS